MGLRFFQNSESSLCHSGKCNNCCVWNAVSKASVMLMQEDLDSPCDVTCTVIMLLAHAPVNGRSDGKSNSHATLLSVVLWFLKAYSKRIPLPYVLLKRWFFTHVVLYYKVDNLLYLLISLERNPILCWNIPTLYVVYNSAQYISSIYKGHVCALARRETLASPVGSS